jgi:hypothetical protein
MVRIHPDPPTNAGAVAQLGEHLLCKQGVVGSIPSSSTNVRGRPRSVQAAPESRGKRRARPLPLVSRNALSVVWFRETRYRLFFNNEEEVKRILLERREGRRKPFPPVARAGWVRLLSIRSSSSSGVAGSANARSLSRSQRSVLWGQATKCMWWMPWRSQAMKDVAACEKLRGAGKRALIRRCPNGETRPARVAPC